MEKGVVRRNLNDWYGGIDISELNNYRTCGVKQIGGRLNDYFKQLFGKAEPPLDVDRCICGHKIQEQSYTCPLDDVRVEPIIIVGNECINKFEDGVMKGRRCEVCNATHKNRNFNLCNEHKKCKQTVSIKFTKLYNQLIARVRGINKYKVRKYIYNSRQKHLLRFCFNTLKVDTKNVYKWKGLISNLSEQQQQNDILNPITKIIKDKAYLLNKIFNMFKVTSYLKYFKESDNVQPLPYDFQKIDHTYLIINILYFHMVN